MADLVLAGADVITLDPQHPAASAVAITGGRITAVGDRHDVRDWRGTRTEVIDLGRVRPGQALTARQALHGYTTAPAYTASAEKINGRIAPGYRADLTAFAASPLQTPPADLPDVPITLTTVDGIIRHQTR